MAMDIILDVGQELIQSSIFYDRKDRKQDYLWVDAQQISFRNGGVTCKPGAAAMVYHSEGSGFRGAGSSYQRLETVHGPYTSPNGRDTVLIQENGTWLESWILRNNIGSISEDFLELNVWDIQTTTGIAATTGGAVTSGLPAGYIDDLIVVPGGYVSAGNSSYYYDLATHTFNALAIPANIALDFFPHMLLFNNRQILWSDTSTRTDFAGGNSGSLDMYKINGHITAAVRIGEEIAVYGRDRMVVVDYLGFPLWFGQRNVVNGLGAVNSRVVQHVNNLNYTLSAAGFFVTDGNTYQSIETPELQYILRELSKDFQWLEWIQSGGDTQYTSDIAANQIQSYHDQMQKCIIWFRRNNYFDGAEGPDPQGLMYFYEQNKWLPYYDVLAGVSDINYNGRAVVTRSLEGSSYGNLRLNDCSIWLEGYMAQALVYYDTATASTMNGGQPAGMNIPPAAYTDYSPSGATALTVDYFSGELVTRSFDMGNPEAWKEIVAIDFDYLAGKIADQMGRISALKDVSGINVYYQTSDVAFAPRGDELGWSSLGTFFVNPPTVNAKTQGKLFFNKPISGVHIAFRFNFGGIDDLVIKGFKLFGTVGQDRK